MSERAYYVTLLGMGSDDTSLSLAQLKELAASNLYIRQTSSVFNEAGKMAPTTPVNAESKDDSATYVALAAPTEHAPALGLYFAEAEGAVGDGVTDDTAALNAALLAAATGKGTLRLSSVLGYVTTKLTPRSNVALRGPGKIGTTLKLKAGSTGGLFDGAVTGITALHVEDLTLDANGAGSTNVGINIVDATRCQVRNVRVLSPRFQGISLHIARECVIEDCEVENSGTGGAGNTSDGSQAGIAVSGNAVGDVDNCRIVNNRVFNSRDAGIINRSGFDYMRNCVVSGNVVDTSTFIGIALNGAKYCLVNNNVVTDCTDNGIDAGNGVDLTITGNTVRNCLSGIDFDHSTTAGRPNASTAIVGNTLANCTQHGIYLAGPVAGSVGFTVTGNTISGSADEGIQLTNICHSTMGSNVVYNAGAGNAGIQLSTFCEYNVITGNKTIDLRGPATSNGLTFNAGYTGGNNLFVANDFSASLAAVTGNPAATDVFRDNRGYQLGPYTAKASASAPGNATTGAVTTIPLDTEVWDTGAMFAPGTPNRMTAPVAGKYLVDISIQWAGDATGNVRQVWGAKNGADATRFAPVSLTTPSGQVWQVAATEVAVLAAGDYVEVHTFHDAAGNVAINSCALSLTKLDY